MIERDFNWYNSLELESFESVEDACFKSSTCKECKCRVNCPIRAFFYLPENVFEFLCQMAEIQTTKDLKIFKNGAYLSFSAAERLRQKRNVELAQYPNYKNT